LAQAGQGSARLPKSYGEQAGGGVMKITPFIPLTLRGTFKGRALSLRGRFMERILILMGDVEGDRK